jgi:hypothetical protein
VKVLVRARKKQQRIIQDVFFNHNCFNLEPFMKSFIYWQCQILPEAILNYAAGNNRHYYDRGEWELYW